MAPRMNARRVWVWRVALLGAVAAVGASPMGAMAAGKYDGSTPFLCVPIAINECTPDGECRRVAAEKVNLPQFLKVDAKAQQVTSEETGRKSPVKNVEHLDGNMILQGGQAGRGWTMTISETTGKMSVAITSEGEGFVVFGACTPLP